ncbi:sporulation delaying protein family toxin [Streptomyces sp. SID4912]|nr:sporulation delaying protein family toxin [Streptomyces sp. SID4941]MYR76115.1 sporulation delaying protein family toxin [Streptomyces sp. SID4925]MYY19991.1 sporulation delaying protein family toxin [Streptomyces sp. SID4912]SBU94650.1 antimicrobial peptide, SdpC family [Streptomyces sp. OspMP-M45]SCD30151.1 antimicrobial peptide, SdpC family [Streptomyces sp. PpalLS-921]SCD31392.1 antimicrobial peptide, SdpC family [Streptomyces sp. PalvLS-984]SCD41345.1 antimicrobial peptide, SdpC famil
MKHYGRIVGIVTAVAVTGAAAFTTIGSANAAPTNVNTQAVTTASAGTERSKPSAAEDGHQLFAGLFFGQGPVAAKLAADGNLNGIEPGVNDNAEAVRAVAELIKKIELKSPGIFADFSAKARSGDPRLVDQAMTAVSQVLVDVSDSNGSVPSESGACVVLVVSVAVAAVAVAVATGGFFINAAAVINVVVNNPAPMENLSRDELVAGLTKVLSTV